jgi:hypothetical protein
MGWNTRKTILNRSIRAYPVDALLLDEQLGCVHLPE